MEREKRRLLNGAVAIINMVNQAQEYSNVNPTDFKDDLEDLIYDLEILLKEVDNES